MKSLPLFGDGIRSYSDVVTAQRRLNCFYDPRKDGDKTAAILRGTPGTQVWVTLPVFPIRGWHAVGNLLYVVAGSNLYSITTTGTITSLGSITKASTLVSMIDNGVELIIVDGIGGYILTFAGSVFSTIVDGNFPNGATTVTFLDGRFIVNKAGTRQFYASQSYAGSNWTPVAFGAKENNSDQLLAVDVVNGLLILFGATTMEFWQDTGAAGLPYTRINGATTTWGLAAVFSRALLSNTEVFLGQNEQGSAQVIMLNGYVPVRISTSDVENIINSFSTMSDAVALTYMIDGHPMYQLTFPTGNRSFLYDALTGLWQEVQTGLALVNRHYGNLSHVFNGVTYLSDYQSGNIYSVADTVYTDNGTLIKRQVATRHIRNDGNMFGIDEIFLDMATGVGLQSGQGSDPQIMMDVSKDGGKTYGSIRTTSLGAVGQYREPRVVFRRLGMARDFVLRFTVTDPVKFIVTGGSAVTRSQEGSNG